MIKKTIIFLTVLFVGLLAISSVSASDMVNESIDLLSDDNNEEMIGFADESINMEPNKNISADTEFNKISIVDGNDAEDILKESNAKIVADSVSINRPSSFFYYFKVVDSNNNPMPNEYYTYKWMSRSGGGHTDSDGVGYFDIDLPWDSSPGDYPIEISSCGVTLTTYVKFSSNAVNYIDYNDVAQYKKTNYFKVEITHFYSGEPIKNLKLALKIYTGKKYKTYYITTNSNGIAKFNTKNLAIGSHKYIVTSTNKKYKIKEDGYITIKKATKKTVVKKTVAKTSTNKKSNTKTVTKGKYKATFSLSTWNQAKKSPGMWDKKITNTGVKTYKGMTIKAYISTYGNNIYVS